MAYSVAGRVFMGAITALAADDDDEAVVTGGAEIKGVRGQEVQARPGLSIGLEKDEHNLNAFFEDDIENYRHVLIPYSGGNRDEWDHFLAPFRNAAFKIDTTAAVGLESLPKTGLLVIPDDPSTDDFLYLPAAQLGPESSDLINMSEIDPVMVEFAEFVPGVAANGTKNFVKGTLAEVAAAISAANP